MSPTQEISTAISMVLPTTVFALDLWTKPPHPCVTILLIGTCIHFPFSFTYHFCSAVNMFHDRFDNNMRRLDQSMQHVISTLFSFALSGSIKYAALNLIVNARGIILLWKKDTSNDGKRWVAIMYCVMLYTLPMLYRGDVINFFTAAISMFLGGILFVP